MESIIVDCYGKGFRLEDATIDSIPKEAFQWSFGGFLDPVGQLIGWLWDQIRPAISAVTTALSSALWVVRDYLYNNLKGVMSGVQSFLANLINAVKNALAPITSAVSGVASSITSFMNQTFSKLATLATSLTSVGSILNTVWNTLSGLGSTLVGSISSLLNSLNNALTSAMSGLGASISGLGSSMSQTFSGLASGLSNLGASISQSLSGIIGTMSSSLNSIASFIGQAISGIGSSIGGLASSIGGSLASMYLYLSTFGTQVIESVLGIKDWILSGFTTVTKTMSDIAVNITGFAGQLPKWFQDVYAWIMGGIDKLGIRLGDWYTGIKTYFTDSYNSMVGGLNDVIRTLTGFINPLIDIKNFFFNQVKSFIDAVVGFFKEPIKTLGNLFKPLTDFFKPLSDFFLVHIKSFLSSIVGFFTNPIKALGELFRPIINIKDFFFNQVKGFIDTFIGFIKDPMKTLGNLFKPLTNFFQPLINFFTKDLPNFFKPLGEFFSDPLKVVMNKFSDLVTWSKTTIFSPNSPALWIDLTGLGSAIVKGIEGIWNQVQIGLGDLWTFISSKIMGFINWAEKSVKSVTDAFGAWVGKHLFTPFLQFPKQFSTELKGLINPQVVSPETVVANMGVILVGYIASPYLISNLMYAMADLLKFEFDIKPFGLGGSAQIDPLRVIKHLAYMIWKIPDIILASVGYGMGIWITQPIAKVMNAYARNDIPIELPNIEEIRTMANRVSTGVAKDAVINQLRTFMMYYGYSDYLVEWNLGISTSQEKPPPDYLNTVIMDRFGKDVKIPLAMRYLLPTPSELSRMMIRDVIQEPDQFANVMTLQGFTPDISRLYYLIHYKYPTFENLWLFYRRCMAGMAWYEPQVLEYPEMRSTLMGDIGLLPVKPQSMNYQDTKLKSMLDWYGKWHDYAPFAWSQGWTSDRWIMADLMADIPMRIDARWLYKWSIIPDGTVDGKTVDSVFNIVRARGIHPRWEEKITIAECMNALQEERTIARTGLMNLMERGFMSEPQVIKKMDNLVDVTLLGKPYPVRFLDGEQKLLVMRATFDRADNVLRQVWSNLTSGLQRNMFPAVMVLNTISNITNKLKKLLGIDIGIDRDFLEVWLEAFFIRHRVETVQRIRYWMRIFIYRATQLAESGEEFEALVDEYSQEAMLTPHEIEIMKSLGRAFIESYRRNKSLSIIQRLVKGKIRSGQWMVEQGITRLIEGGMSRLDAQAYIEADVQTRTVSIDKLISMSEVIPIDIEMLKAKMDAEGVPENEKNLYVPYAIGKEIASEQSKLVTQVIDDWVESARPTSELKASLDEIATLWGKAPTDLKVAWINHSPEERDILIKIAEKRRLRWATPTEKMKTVSADKIISLMENIPISMTKLREKMIIENIPMDEQKYYLANALASELSEEIHRLATEYVTDYSKGLFTLPQLRKAFDDLATLGGSVPSVFNQIDPKDVKIDWIVLSPQERELLVGLAKLRLARA